MIYPLVMTNNPIIQDRLRQFFAEDLGFGDITTSLLIDDSIWCEAAITAKEELVLAGLEEVEYLFSTTGCSVDRLHQEGIHLEAGMEVLRVKGPARAILELERVVINILSRMSGIATATRSLAERARSVDPKVKVAATRKTAPGLMMLDKRAILIGGGDTHRWSLDDCILIKDNHIKIVGGLTESVLRAKRGASFTKKVEVEVTTPEEAVEAAEAGADIVMLDNMKPSDVSRAVKELIRRGLRDKIIVEISGMLKHASFDDYARAGGDIISSGGLTHSVKAVDMSLEVISSWRGKSAQAANRLPLNPY